MEVTPSRGTVKNATSGLADAGAGTGNVGRKSNTTTVLSKDKLKNAKKSSPSLSKNQQKMQSQTVGSALSSNTDLIQKNNKSSINSPKNKTSLWGKEKYVTEKGLNTVKQHLSGDLSAEFNDAMINRLETAYQNNTKISGADLDFYAHELYEFNKMKNGMEYEQAHEAAKIYYNAVEFNFYHPEMIKQNQELFSKVWFEFWGIERD